jgi:hypothetical protein
MRWTEHGADKPTREMINAYKILPGDPEGKRPLGSPCEYGDNIKIYLK